MLSLGETRKCERADGACGWTIAYHTCVCVSKERAEAEDVGGARDRARLLGASDAIGGQLGRAVAQARRRRQAACNQSDRLSTACTCSVLQCKLQLY